MMNSEKFNAIKSAIRDGKAAQAAGGIRVTKGQSDKLGYDWTVYTVNDIEVRKEYIAQETPVEYADGVPLISNAFYRKDGKVYVWMEEWVEWTE